MNCSNCDTTPALPASGLCPNCDESKRGNDTLIGYLTLMSIVLVIALFVAFR
jgi:hypothetical protein